MIHCIFSWRGTISPLPPPHQPRVPVPDAQSPCPQVRRRTFLIDSSPRLTCCVHICKPPLISSPRYYRQSLHQHTICPLSSLCRCYNDTFVTHNWIGLKIGTSSPHQINGSLLCWLVAQHWFALSPVRSTVYFHCMPICSIYYTLIKTHGV